MVEEKELKGWIVIVLISNGRIDSLVLHEIFQWTRLCNTFFFFVFALSLHFLVMEVESSLGC